MTHAVALIPGFLGFDHLGDRTYFADRFIAGLRAALEARCHLRALAVVPVTTLPFGTLYERQTFLIKELENLASRLGNPTWHLVGHSTGGLDAALLAGSKRLCVDEAHGSRFSEEDQSFGPLRSVVALAAPIFGTTLALSPLSSAIMGVPSLAAARMAIEAVADAGQLDALSTRLNFLWSALRSAGHGLWPHGLARDLRPDVAGSLSQANVIRSGIAVSSIATLAPEPASDHEDKLFRDLWRWTAGSAAAAGSAPAPPTFVMPARVIASSNALVPNSVRPSDSDGVVNTNRQVVGDLKAVVVGDHGDVIGQYRRVDERNGKLIQGGLLTSGAAFGDADFFELIGVIADAIASAIG